MCLRVGGGGFVNGIGATMLADKLSAGYAPGIDREGRPLLGKSIRSVLAGALLLIATLAPSGAIGDSYYYYSEFRYDGTKEIAPSYSNKKIALTPASGWIAIRGQADGLVDSVRSLIADSDLVEEKGYEHAISGWYLAHFPEDGEQATLIDELVTADNEDGVRDYYFAPVYRGRSGGKIMPGDSVLLEWLEAPVSELLESELPEYCEGDPERSKLASMESVYRIRPRCHSGLSLLEYANRLAERSETVFSEPDFVVSGEREPESLVRSQGKTAGWPAGRAKLIPGDPQFSDSWHWENTGQEGGEPGMDVNITAAWDLTTGEVGVETAIIDVGVDQGHSDISQEPGRDFTGQGSAGGGPVNECDNHGTPVAGAVSAKINNGEGTVGAAPATISRSARTFISEVDDPCSGRWTTQVSWTVDALDWALDQGMRVTNNSNSYDQPSSTIASKYQETHDLGMVHFASAGNEGAGSMNFPASLSWVNAVSAVDRRGQLAGFSNFGSGLSVSAPGVAIHLPDRQGSEGYESGDLLVGDGTSFASPIAAGVAGLLLSRAWNLDGREVELFLEAAARDLGPGGKDEEYGWGLVNAHGALLLLDIFADDLESGSSDRWSKTVP